MVRGQCQGRIKSLHQWIGTNNHSLEVRIVGPFSQTTKLKDHDLLFTLVKLAFGHRELIQFLSVGCATYL